MKTKKAPKLSRDARWIMACEAFRAARREYDRASQRFQEAETAKRNASEVLSSMTNALMDDIVAIDGPR